jgi:AAA15 family ATPase/GTPase
MVLGMITEMKVDNYKCFGTIDLKALSRINVVVGDNGAGKTVLLQAAASRNSRPLVLCVTHSAKISADIRRMFTADSGGSQKLEQILADIAMHTGGFVTIDDFEGGFHHQKLNQLWDVVYRFANEFDTQVFVTVYSKEALLALLPLLRIKPDDFRLIRVEKRYERHGAAVFTGSELEAALETGVDVR